MRRLLIHRSQYSVFYEITNARVMHLCFVNSLVSIFIQMEIFFSFRCIAVLPFIYSQTCAKQALWERQNVALVGACLSPLLYL